MPVCIIGMSALKHMQLPHLVLLYVLLLAPSIIPFVSLPSYVPGGALHYLQTATDFGSYLANEASPLYTSTIVDRCTQKLVDDWTAMRCQVGSKGLSSFLEPSTPSSNPANPVFIGSLLRDSD